MLIQPLTRPASGIFLLEYPEKPPLKNMREIREHIISQSQNIKKVFPSEKGCSEVAILLERCKDLRVIVGLNFVGEPYFKFYLEDHRLFC